ncbi:MAG: glycine C-acetyltransferase [Planctomycetales bacterium 4572_13]|nr:MAG: glycine C-acetyltransferase [Planctomycetales bacterium 4572_13]
MFKSFKRYIEAQLDEIRSGGLYKEERIIISPQNAKIKVAGGDEVLNFCANNYLGLANDSRLIAAAKQSYDKWGFGLSSVRFICGTQQLHKQLEAKLSEFLGSEDTILYSSCFDANGGLFETLLGPEDAVISDELNHASIIDGIRLCKAKRFRFKNCDMADLETKLIESQDCPKRLIATDGVFSMDGTIARLDKICDLADKYDAVVMVDDSHATGFIGQKGRGTHEYRGVIDRVDILTGTFGKALGGASGGYTSGRKEIVELLRQRSRPYLFSNTLAPAVAATTLKVLDIILETTELRDKLENNTRYFREKIKQAGFDIPDGDHPIVPIMLGDAELATKMAERLLSEGVYVVGFSYPVVPKGKARIRVQISAAHSKENLDFAIQKFVAVKSELT